MRHSLIEKGRFKVEIPEGGLDKWANLELKERGDYPAPLKDIKVIKVAEFNLSPVSTRILKPIKVTFDYSGLLVQGMIEKRLMAYYIVAGSWERIESQEIDIENNRLTFYLPYFSLIGIGTEVVKPLSELKVYPNPAREKITFGDNLYLTIEIKIYNIVGEEIYGYAGETNGGKWSWDLRNRDKQRIASGIYIYVIRSGGEKKVGKIGVVR